MKKMIANNSHDTHRPSTHARSRRGGFTMMELLIVVTIIIILIGISLAAFNSKEFVKQRNRTLTTLAGAEAVATEYLAVTGGYVIKIGESGDPPPGVFFSNDTYKGDNTAEQFVSAIRSTPECLTILFMLPIDQIDTDSDGEADTILDGWGNPIRYASWVTDDESELPRHRSPFFASAGSDGEWGDATSTNEDDLAAAEDNFYSFSSSSD